MITPQIDLRCVDISISFVSAPLDNKLEKQEAGIPLRLEACCKEALPPIVDAIKTYSDATFFNRLGMEER